MRKPCRRIMINGSWSPFLGCWLICNLICSVQTVYRPNAAKTGRILLTKRLVTWAWCKGQAIGKAWWASQTSHMHWRRLMALGKCAGLCFSTTPLTNSYNRTPVQSCTQSLLVPLLPLTNLHWLLEKWHWRCSSTFTYIIILHRRPHVLLSKRPFLIITQTLRDRRSRYLV